MNLTPNIKTLTNYIYEVAEDVPRDVVLLILLSKLAQVGMLNRLQTDSFRGKSISNIYALNFMPSGSGKDKTVTIVDEYLMQPYFKEFKQKEEDFVTEELKRLEEVSDSQGLTENQAVKFIKDSKPRQLVHVFQNATTEGFLAVRKEFERAQFGGTLIVISEFSDYILNSSTSKEEFLSMIKEVYEHGSNHAKVIKMEKRGDAVSGVPCSVLFQSTPTGLTEGVGVDKMKAFLNKGIARRALLCYPDIKKLDKENINFDEYLEKLEELKEAREEMQKIVSRAVHINPLRNVFKFDRKANEALFEFEREAKGVSYEDNRESLIANLYSEPRKAQKLAGVIALIEHPMDSCVYKEDFMCAKSIVKHYSGYLEKFIEKLYEDDIRKLFNYLLQNEGTWLKKMDIREQKFVGTNRFTQWLDNALPEVKTLAIFNGYELKEQEIGSIGIQYMLQKSI